MRRLAYASLIVLTATPAYSDMTVLASYYGNELRGHRTASGERFNPGGMTAAHRTLPFGTCLKVSYRNRSVKVRINDRGPFVRGRGLDLSHGAARALGMGGTARVSYKKC